MIPMKYDDTDLAARYASARGTGRFTTLLADVFDAEVLGIDPSRTMLAKARADARPRIRYLDGEAENLPVEDGSCCLVFLSMAYHHIADPRRAALEFVRALRPGGYVCIRNSTLEHVERIPYQKYFPGAAEIQRRMLPSSCAPRSASAQCRKP